MQLRRFLAGAAEMSAVRQILSRGVPCGALYMRMLDMSAMPFTAVSGDYFCCRCHTQSMAGSVSFLLRQEDVGYTCIVASLTEHFAAVTMAVACGVKVERASSPSAALADSPPCTDIQCSQTASLDAKRKQDVLQRPEDSSVAGCHIWTPGLVCRNTGAV